MGETCHRPGIRNHLLANRELRDGRVLKVFRHVDPEHSSSIADILTDWARSGDLPEFDNIPRKHTAYILDPRLMGQGFKRGFVPRYRPAEARREIERSCQDSSQAVMAKIGKISVEGRNRKVVLAQLASEELLEERKELYGILGSAGLKGTSRRMNGKGGKISCPTLFLGVLHEGVSRTEQGELGEKIDMALSMYGSDIVQLGPSQVEVSRARND